MIRSKEINYRFVERVDESLYNKIVDFHRTTFPTGIISSMGLDFIKSYYNELLHNKHCKMICAYDGDAVVGFIVYCEKPDLLRQETNLPVLKKKILFHVITLRLNPVIFLRGMIKKMRSKSIEGLPELSVIAVEEQYRRYGIGGKLVHMMEEDLLSMGSNDYCVFTDNEEGLQFYQKKGFETVFRFRFFGITSACFRKTMVKK